MKHPTTRQDAAGLAWKPRLKNAPRSTRSAASSATTRCADQALAAMQRIDQVKKHNDGVIDESSLARLAGRYLPEDAAASPARSRVVSRVAAGRSRGIKALLAGLAAAAAVCIVSAIGLGRTTARHTVVGRIYVDQKPLGSAELRFHPGGEGTAAVSVVAAQDGQFRLEDVAAGHYRVTIHPQSGTRRVPLAAAYAKAETTPLHVRFIQDIDRLQLHASRIASTPGGE